MPLTNDLLFVSVEVSSLQTPIPTFPKTVSRSISGAAAADINIEAADLVLSEAPRLHLTGFTGSPAALLALLWPLRGMKIHVIWVKSEPTCQVCDSSKGRGLVHSTGWSHLGWKASDGCQLPDAGEGRVWFIVSYCSISICSCTEMETVEPLLHSFYFSFECMLCCVCCIHQRSSTSLIIGIMLHQNTHICRASAAAKWYYLVSWFWFTAAHSCHINHLFPCNLFLYRRYSGVVNSYSCQKTLFYPHCLHFEHAFVDLMELQLFNQLSGLVVECLSWDWIKTAVKSKMGPWLTLSIQVPLLSCFDLLKNWTQ